MGEFAARRNAQTGKPVNFGVAREPVYKTVHWRSSKCNFHFHC